ncbi:hypothetical protein PR048_030225 [Dryococelus australis]|uniref:Uncharacterized protein n=1 Tax=Dryococelus australis TaxID=614101 RepID=A0ABQ9G8C5_9NEOP|nr:hypothetical protein PR048_030225 [Dryococelus australis]
MSGGSADNMHGIFDYIRATALPLPLTSPYTKNIQGRILHCSGGGKGELAVTCNDVHHITNVYLPPGAVHVAYPPGQTWLPLYPSTACTTSFPCHAASPGRTANMFHLAGVARWAVCIARKATWVGSIHSLKKLLLPRLLFTFPLQPHQFMFPVVHFELGQYQVNAERVLHLPQRALFGQSLLLFVQRSRFDDHFFQLKINGRDLQRARSLCKSGMLYGGVGSRKRLTGGVNDGLSCFLSTASISVLARHDTLFSSSSVLILGPGRTHSSCGAHAEPQHCSTSLHVGFEPGSAGAAGRWVFSGLSHFAPGLHFDTASHLPRFIHIGSKDPDLYYSPPTNANWIRFLVESLPRYSHMEIVPDDDGRWLYSGISRFPPHLHFGAAPYSPHFPPKSLQFHATCKGAPRGLSHPILEGCLPKSGTYFRHCSTRTLDRSSVMPGLQEEE